MIALVSKPLLLILALMAVVVPQRSFFASVVSPGGSSGLSLSSASFVPFSLLGMGGWLGGKSLLMSSLLVGVVENFFIFGGFASYSLRGVLGALIWVGVLWEVGVFGCWVGFFCFTGVLGVLGGCWGCLSLLMCLRMLSMSSLSTVYPSSSLLTRILAPIIDHGMVACL